MTTIIIEDNKPFLACARTNVGYNNFVILRTLKSKGSK